jgi:hypothetical protein
VGVRSLNAISRIVVPDVVGRVGHRTGRSEAALGAVLRQNRLQVLEHDWTKQLSSTIGGSSLSSKRKEFFEGSQYIDGYKVLANLFYKRPLQNTQFVFGVEVEYAERTNMNGTRNGTTRVGALVYYDF